MTKRSSFLENFGVRLVSLLVALAGIINLFSAASPALTHRFKIIRDVLPLSIIQGARVISAVAGFFLLLLAFSLWRRKYVARILAITILLLSALAHLAKGLDFEESAYMLVLAILLVVLEPFFHARSDQPSIKQSLMVLLVALAFTSVYVFAGIYFTDIRYHLNLTGSEIVSNALRFVTQFPSPHLVLRNRLAGLFISSVYLIAFVTLGYSIFKLFSPVLLKRNGSDFLRAKAKEIIEKYGKSVLARFALLPDKNYFFCDSAVIAYVANGRNALVLGDPIGDPRNITGCIENFKNFCSQNDWRPVFYQTTGEYWPAYESLGFSRLEIGNEAVVKLGNFSISGAKNKKLRNAYNRTKGLGYKVEVSKSAPDKKLFNKLQVISDSWLDKKNGREETFSLGWFDEEYLKSTIMAVVYSPDNQPVGFVNLIPEYQKNEVAIDLMRSCDLKDNGVMEFLFIELMNWASEQGYESFNLGLSPLAKVGEGSKDRAAEKALRFIYHQLSHWHGFKGLYHFKSKFNPDWQTRYLVYPKNDNLIPIMWALVKVHR